MKFLRLYEEYSKYSTKKISMIQFEDIVFDEYLDIKNEAMEFTKSEIKTIQTWMLKQFPNAENSTKLRKFLVDIPVHSPPESLNDIVQLHTNINNGEFLITIYKMEDEWYPISIFGYGYANCDQLGGLFEYLLEFKKEENI